MFPAPRIKITTKKPGDEEEEEKKGVVEADSNGGGPQWTSNLGSNTIRDTSGFNASNEAVPGLGIEKGAGDSSGKGNVVAPRTEMGAGDAPSNLAEQQLQQQQPKPRRPKAAGCPKCGSCPPLPGPPPPCCTEVCDECTRLGDTTACGLPRVPRMCCNKVSPPVPSHNYEKVPVEDAKNYIHSNVVKALRMPARKPNPRVVIHPKGHTAPYAESGLARRYVYSDTFGTVPHYIQNIKAQLRREDQEKLNSVKAVKGNMNDQCRHLEPLEQQAIINGLKANWAEKFREFNTLPLHSDTQAKVKKKKELEDELKQLEKDIQIFERHNHVFVSDTCRSFYL